MALFSSPSTAHVASDASGEGGDGGEDGGEPASSAQCARTAASARARAACHSSGSKPDAPRCASSCASTASKLRCHTREPPPRQRFTQLCWPDLEQSPRERAFSGGRKAAEQHERAAVGLAAAIGWRLGGGRRRCAPFASMSRRERFSRPASGCDGGRGGRGVEDEAPALGVKLWHHVIERVDGDAKRRCSRRHERTLAEVLGAAPVYELATFEQE